MRLFRRGPDLPERVREAVQSRPLAAAEADDHTWVVCTRDACWLVDGEGAEEIPWERVHRAEWDQESATLRIEPVEAYGAPVHARTLVVPEPGPLLDVLRERVTASVLLQRRVDVQRRRGFTLIARRPPSRPGEVTWAYEIDPGLDPHAPEVAEAAARALREAEESLGL